MHETSLKQRFQKPAHCLNWLPSAVHLFIFPLPRKRWEKKKKIVYFKGHWNPSFKREYWKEKKREREKVLCKSSEGFQNFSFLSFINMIFPFALSSPLWHSWYISLSIISNFKAPPPSRFVNPLDCSDGRSCFYFLEVGVGVG